MVNKQMQKHVIRKSKIKSVINRKLQYTEKLIEVADKRRRELQASGNRNQAFYYEGELVGLRLLKTNLQAVMDEVS
jgi:hypothetical protein